MTLFSSFDNRILIKNGATLRRKNFQLAIFMPPPQSGEGYTVLPLFIRPSVCLSVSPSHFVIVFFSLQLLLQYLMQRF